MKTAIHKIYRRFVHLRTFLREQMALALLEYVERPAERGCAGVFETLEILGSIVEGFAVPLKASFSLLFLFLCLF